MSRTPAISVPSRCSKAALIASLVLAFAAALYSGPQKGIVAPDLSTFRLKQAFSTLQSTYRDSGGAAFSMSERGATPLSLAMGDLNHDGYPDLVVGYASGDGGLIAIHWANPEAFSPHGRKSLDGIAKGQFPPSFQDPATVLYTIEAPSFLATVYFAQNGGTGILFAAKGGRAVHVLLSNGSGGFLPERTISVSGAITALTTNPLPSGGGIADVVLGADTGAGSVLLLFNSRNLLAGNPITIPVPGSVTSLAIGDLDGDRYPDVAVAASGHLYILHGADSASAGRQDRLESVPLASPIQKVALGDFTTSGVHGTEIAALANDGSVHVLAGGRSIPGLATPPPYRRGRAPLNQVLMWQPGSSPRWTETQRISSAAASRPAELFSGRYSGHSAEDLLVTGSGTGRVTVLNTGSRTVSGGSHRDLQSIATLDAGGPLIAMLRMRLNVMGSAGFVALVQNDPAPRTAAPQPIVTFTVTTLDDSPGGNCTDTTGESPTSSCTTLRAAVDASNGIFGGNLILFGPDGTITLSVGDLEVTTSLTIMGDGASSTIIQAGSSTGNGVDKVFSFNPLGQLPGFDVSLSGLTIQYGTNALTDFSIGNNEGGAFDFDAGLEDGAGTLSIANCSILQNSTTNGDGGGIALFDGGSVGIMDSVFSGNQSNMLESTPFYGGAIFIGNAGPFAAGVGIIRTAFIGNSAVSGGGAIFSYGPETFVQDSRIVSNVSMQGATAIDGAADPVVVATGNWWGSNGSPSGAVNPAFVLFDNWLVMTLAANPTTLNPGDTSVAAAAFSSTPNGGVDQFFPATPVNFAATLGTVDPALTTTSYGAANSVFKAGSAGGNASVSATIDNQTLSVPVTINGGGGSSNPSGPSPAVSSFTGGHGYVSIDGTAMTAGWSFEATANLTVSALGFWSYDTTVPLNSSHQVGLWASDGTLVASATVQPDSPATGSWLYVSIAPVALVAGQVYTVGFLITSPWTDPFEGVPVSGGAVVTSPLITLTGAFNSPSGSGFAFPSISTSRYLASFGANLIITPAGSN